MIQRRGYVVIHETLSRDSFSLVLALIPEEGETEEKTEEALAFKVTPTALRPKTAEIGKFREWRLTETYDAKTHW